MRLDHRNLTDEKLKKLLKMGVIKFAGNRPLKIYGELWCSSGMKMNKKNRVFFTDEQSAIDRGYRPCGHCMRKEYDEWKRNQLKRKTQS